MNLHASDEDYLQRIFNKEPFGGKKISQVKLSDAKLFLIKLQSDGRGYSSIHSIRGVLRPAFQMAVNDDVLHKNPFGFELATVIVNDSVTREAITKDQMRKFLKFIHDDNYNIERTLGALLRQGVFSFIFSIPQWVDLC